MGLVHMPRTLSCWRETAALSASRKAASTLHETGLSKPSSAREYGLHAGRAGTKPPWYRCAVMPPPLVMLTGSSWSRRAGPSSYLGPQGPQAGAAARLSLLGDHWAC